VNVAGATIHGGMIYVGKDLAPIGGWHQREPALIDPSLPVTRRSPAREGDGMSYWPSYSEIPPECRAAYLEWLANGRSDPNAYIGYVFLYFYGLERRLLFDLRHLPGRRQEAQQLLSELERLLSLYSGNRSFQGYGTSLLETARALWADDQAYDRPPSFQPGRRELPSDVRLAVGQLITEEKPIPGDWALAWVIGHPETRLGTPARRCPEEFRELFLRRFTDRFGTGMTLKPNKRRLRISHIPASASFGAPVEIPFDNLPDIASLSNPVRALRELAESAALELESYSRFVGRDPKQARSLHALALLPRELAETRPSPGVDRLRAWIDSTLGSEERAVATASDLMTHWECARTDRMRKGEVGSFAKMLESLGCGVEPDPRYGGGALAADQKIVLFRLCGEHPSAVSPTYHAATLLLQLAAAVASSDGGVGEEEERHLEEHLERSMGLAGAEVHRLRAHLQWLLVSRADLTGLKRRVEEIDARGRHQLAQFAVAIAGADGVIDPEEVKTLVKIYRMLGLDPDQAYGDIHSLRTGSTWSPADQPVTVRPPEAIDAGYPITGRPQASPSAATGFRLDMDRVEQTLVETAAVSSVLAKVFLEDEDPAASLTETPEESNVAAGLDASHTRLLRALTGRTEISRQEFEEITEGLRLLPDGAFETLNEVAFDRADGPLLEGEDPIAVNLETLGELMQ
jgi:tellurite resistance protein